MSWTDMHIEDEAGNKGFRVSASPMSAPGQLRTLRHHLDNINNHNPAYAKVGIKAPAFIVIDGVREMTDDDLYIALVELEFQQDLKMNQVKARL